MRQLHQRKRWVNSNWWLLCDLMLKKWLHVAVIILINNDINMLIYSHTETRTRRKSPERISILFGSSHENYAWTRRTKHGSSSDRYVSSKLWNSYCADCWFVLTSLNVDTTTFVSVAAPIPHYQLLFSTLQ